jgi:signal transduction histidine kinase
LLAGHVLPLDFQADIDAIARLESIPMILDVISRTTGMGFAAVARVTDSRWIACQTRDTIAFGLAPGDELTLTTTVCDEIRQSGREVVIDNVGIDPVFCNHHTPALYGFKSYISMPIIRGDGSFFGTLCAIDPKPAKLQNPETIGMFKLFAQLIATQLDAEERMAQSESALLDERRLAETREQFIAILGHDLRNPVAAVVSGARMLLKTPLNEKASTIVNLMIGSAVRMNALIDNVMDFARGRLGEGFLLDRRPVSADSFKKALKQVIGEMRALDPDRVIKAHLRFEEMLYIDQARVGQMFSNLLGNALTYGAAGMPVRVQALIHDGMFELSVANTGKAIPDNEMADLFKPFSRGKARPSVQGLGLGLFIAYEIARAHGGTLTATSSIEQTRFTFRMPMADKSSAPP